MTDTLWLSDSIVDIRQEELGKLTSHINVIESAARGKLKETGHSRILVDLLQHPVLQKSFFKLFLGVDLPFLQVDREIGTSKSHIDVALYDDKHFVMVENKVNNAVDQDRQIYRYVHDIGIKQYGKDIKDIWVENLIFKTGGVDGCNCAETLELIRQGKIDTTWLITHKYPLSRIEEAYYTFENRLDNVIKTTIYPD